MTYDHNNIFAKILRGEIPCKKVYEDSYVFAFEDITPATPVHILVIPKKEYISFDDFAKNTSANYMHGFFTAVQKVAAQSGADQNGYRIISNHGADAAQSVPHFHVHILAGRQMGDLVP